MPKTSVTDYDTVAANNSDVGGINIAEGCPAAGINNAIREVMAQIAAWRDGGIAALLAKSGGTMSGDIAEMGSGSTIKDPGGTVRKLGYRNIPLRAATSQQTLALADVGTMISITTGGLIVPANATVAFAVGDLVSGYNNSGSSQSITGAAGVTLRLGGTSSTGTRTVAQRGFATILKLAADEWLVFGTGVS